MLPLDTQHIGSDHAFLLDGVTEEEPQPDNPSRLSPFSPQETYLPTTASARPASRTRVQMKVQDGCDNRCTYCIVPYVRGGSRSRNIASVVEHVQRKVRAGYQEIVLTGIHLGDYHPGDNEEQNLGDLIAALLRETTIPRIRVSSLEPPSETMIDNQGFSPGVVASVGKSAHVPPLSSPDAERIGRHPAAHGPSL